MVLASSMNFFGFFRYSSDDKPCDENVAKGKLDKILKVLRASGISLELLQFNGFRAGGKNRCTFVQQITKALVAKVIDSPDIFDECKVIVNDAAVDDINCMVKNNKQLFCLKNFLMMFNQKSIQ